MFDIQEHLKQLPDKPGVYLHKDKFGKVIYVGKAISLKNRVRQYFQAASRLDAKTRAMVSHIEEFEYIITDSEMEALILENNLIKKYMPQYNVLLRDDKTYPYIKVTTNEPYPRVLKTRRILNDGCKYFGPYTDVGAVNQIIDLIGSIYSLKKCSLIKFPEGFRPCLNFHIGQCPGICTGNVDQKAYLSVIDDVVDFLHGRNKKLLHHLEEEMAQASEELRFERAAELRDAIAAVHAIQEKQKVVLSSTGDMDVVLAARGLTSTHVVMFFVRGGKLSGRENYLVQATEEDARNEVVEAFLKQYYSETTLIPKEILLEEELPEQDLIRDWLTSQRGSQVKLTVPQKGEKKAFLELSRRNVVEMSKYLDDRAQHQLDRVSTITEGLARIFGGAKGSARPGWRIEAYDISNTAGVDTVGAMVVYQDGRPVRKDYRKFKIRTIEGSNDYGSMQEMLYRRWKRGLAEDEGFATLPDLILIDGGAGHVTAASQVLSAMQVTVPVAGMVKDDRHRTRALIYQGEEIRLQDQPALYKYISLIQEEVHRFAIEYHRGLRGKTVQRSQLEEIQGIGEKRRNALLQAFGSIDAIRRATMEELCQVEGMNRLAAEKILEWQLHNSIEKDQA